MLGKNKPSTTKAATDIEVALLTRIAEHRDSRALEQLYKLYHPRIYSFLRRFTHDEAMIDDTFNEVMYRVWNSAHQYKGTAKVSSWIFSIAYRTCLMLLKKHNHQYNVVAALDLEQCSSAAVTESTTQEDQQLIEKALTVLPEKQRLVLELNYYMGFTLQEIADMTDCSVNTVKTRLRYARHKLRGTVNELTSERRDLCAEARSQ